jgi:hypothetical protein
MLSASLGRCAVWGISVYDLYISEWLQFGLDMSQLKVENGPPAIWEMIVGDGTPRKAVFTALIVGTLLTIINHGDVLIAGEFPPPIKVFLTYCVPYCVTTWGAVTGKRAQWAKQNVKHVGQA